MAAELEARLRSMALNDVEAAISGGDVEAVRRWAAGGGTRTNHGYGSSCSTRSARPNAPFRLRIPAGDSISKVSRYRGGCRYRGGTPRHHASLRAARRWLAIRPAWRRDSTPCPRLWCGTSSPFGPRRATPIIKLDIGLLRIVRHRVLEYD